MFNSSTYFIKAQVPGLTIAHLLNFYKRELHLQQVSDVHVTGNRIDFTNNNFKLVIDRYANKFSSFSSGHIIINDEDDKFVIRLHASMKKLWVNAAVFALIAGSFILFDDGFSIFPLVFGGAIFVLLTIIGFVITQVSFPVYFVRLRNKIQQELEAMKN